MQQATHPISHDRTSPRRGTFTRALQTAAALGLLTLAGVVSSASSTGCSSSCEGFTRTTTGTDGVATETCEALCDVTKCGEHGACVDNKCALTCTGQLDCNAGEDCVAAKDDKKADLAICQPNLRGTIGIHCPFGQGDCAVNGAFACPDGKACDPTCTTNCPCAADQCQALFCRTAGQGDADALCTLQDCHADADCPGGFWCSQVRDPQQICGPTCTASKCASGPKQGATCTKDADCEKGNSKFCGGKVAMPPACIQPADLSANGQTFVEAQYCALRNECAVRGQCAPCASDLDCSLVAGQRCTQVGAEKVCTKTCASDSDCENAFACTAGACVPRFGACVGSAKFCEPCRTDLDCGSKDGTMACISFSGGAEKVCVDIGNGSPCTTDDDCPTTPEGKHGLCADDRIGSSSGDGIFHTCYLPPYNASTNQFSCWRGNTGTGCYTNDDCFSKKCVGGNATSGAVGACQ
jgi:hypothetical protein